MNSTIRGSAQKSSVEVLSAITAAASSVTTSLHVVGDLSATARVKSQRFLHDVRVKDIATRVVGDNNIIASASIEVARSMIQLEDELAKDQRLKTAYDTLHERIASAVGNVKP